MLFPRLKSPDFAISLGTGEPAPTGYDASTEDRRHKYKMFPRLWDLIMEKMRDKAIRKVSKALVNVNQKYHRLSIGFESSEPKLDDSTIIPDLIAKVETDKSLSESIDDVAHCLVASLFYFELDSLPDWRDGKYLLRGRILCVIQQGETAFKDVAARLSKYSARFCINDGQIIGPTEFSTGHIFSLGVEFRSSNEFAITMKLNDDKTYGISGSPYVVEELVGVQGLDAYFGRSDHRKRKASNYISSERKRHCVGLLPRS